jgi:hypothetical protein
MEKEKRPKTPLIAKVDETNNTITIPFIYSANDLSWNKLHQDIERIQFYSIGNGGTEIPGKVKEGLEDIKVGGTGVGRDNGELIFKFESEEFNCVLRYLLRTDWKRV